MPLVCSTLPLTHLHGTAANSLISCSSSGRFPDTAKMKAVRKQSPHLPCNRELPCCMQTTSLRLFFYFFPGRKPSSEISHRAVWRSSLRTMAQIIWAEEQGHKAEQNWEHHLQLEQKKKVKIKLLVMISEARWRETSVKVGHGCVWLRGREKHEHALHHTVLEAAAWALHRGEKVLHQNKACSQRCYKPRRDSLARLLSKSVQTGAARNAQR